MKQRQLGPFQVAEIGLGCMNLSHAYGTPPPADEAERLLRRAIDAGVTLFDTAALYGFGANEALVGRVLKPHRSRVVLCSKGGMTGQPVGSGGALQRVIDGRPASIRRDCEASLQRLGTDVIDLYYLHRWDKRVPIEDSVGAMSRLVERGLVRALGLSEVSAATLMKAHAVHPIAAVQTEYSLWTRNPEIAVLAACREIGAAFVAFSPLGRAFLAAALRDLSTLQPKDIRTSMPRFEPAHHAANLALLPAYEALAAEAGCTPAQLALAWLLSRGGQVIPIPGTSSLPHLLENLGAATVQPAPGLLARLDGLIHQGTVSGARYNAQSQSDVDTEQF
jgi:aryl-alcohol dehydrogenase-like predicted oxidoreductase